MKFSNMKLENIIYILLLVFFGLFILMNISNKMNNKENMTSGETSSEKNKNEISIANVYHSQ